MAGRDGDGRAELAELSEWVADLRWEHAAESVQQRLLLVLHDTIAVMAAGNRLPETRAVAEQWPGLGSTGCAPIIGAGTRADVDAAAWLNGYATVSLELDEGNKYARGHPAAHGFAAVLAAGSARDVDGRALCTALLCAYEVASRFGRATRLRAGSHPHGSWGVAGAAAGVAKLYGLPTDRIGAALDTAAGLPIAAPFVSALDGNPVRNAWIGASNVSGLIATRIAAAGVAMSTGTAASTLGGPLGGFNPRELTDELGSRFDVTGNYFKRHAACSFTHPPADAILEILEAEPSLRAEDVQTIIVETHSLAAGLTRTELPTRLAAMFSIPHVVAVALVRGRIDVDAAAADARADPVLAGLAERVTVQVAPDLEARLGRERPARVTVRTLDGRELRAEVPNPIGDADHHPLSATDIDAKARRLVGDRYADVVADVVHRLPSVPSVSEPLAALA